MVFLIACFHYVNRRIDGPFRLITFARVRVGRSCRAGCPRDPIFSARLFLSGLDYGLVSWRRACYRLVRLFLILVDSPRDRRVISCSGNRGFRFGIGGDYGRILPQNCGINRLTGLETTRSTSGQVGQSSPAFWSRFPSYHGSLSRVRPAPQINCVGFRPGTWVKRVAGRVTARKGIVGVCHQNVLCESGTVRALWVSQS